MVYTFVVFAVAVTICSGFHQTSFNHHPSHELSSVSDRHRHVPAWETKKRIFGGSSLSFVSLMATPDAMEDPPSSVGMAKKRLCKAYEVGQYAFGAAAVVILAIPDRTLTTLLATKWGGAAGFVIAGGLCRILRDANKNDRLGSDTYKRLNLALLGFAGLGLTAIPGEAAFMNTAGSAMILSGLLTTLRLFGTFLAFTGWKRGVLETNDEATPKRFLGELVQGSKDTIKGLKVTNGKKALTYRNCLLLVCFGILSSFMEGIFNIRFRKEFTRTWFEISLQWSAVARLFMIATMIYSLKDAAERDRLTGTTFIEMNIMVGAWAVLVGLGQAVYPLGFAAYRGVEMFAFSIPFFLKAYKSRKEKSEKIKERS